MIDSLTELLKQIIEYQIKLWSASTASAVVGVAVFDFLLLYAVIGTWAASKKLTMIGIILVIVFGVTFVTSISSLFDVSLTALASGG